MMGRAWFLVVMLVGGLAAVAWALHGGSLPPADFTFCNESEIKSVDPAIINGTPEGRVCWSLFEGLARPRPEDCSAEPGVAESWDISDDGRVYTFHLRDNARWSNGDFITANDFAYSFRRLLDPTTGSEYSYQGWYVVNAKRYSSAGNGIAPGDPVEVELNRAAEVPNTVRGRLLLGTLMRVEGAANDQNNSQDGEKADASDRVFAVEIDGRERRFKLADDNEPLPEGIEPCRQLLLDFREVGVRVIDVRTLEIRLNEPTAYFLELLAYYPFSLVNQKCLEKYGSPAWTRPENIVTNGAFKLQERRIRDRTRLVKNDMYWDRDNVQLNVVDVLAVEDRTTAINLYMTGASDWVTQPQPNAIRRMLEQRPPRNDLQPAPQLTTYFYMVNTTRPPLDDVRVRRALSMALDRREITETATAAGEEPIYSLVPPIIPGYDPQPSASRDPDQARKLLAEAGYPGGAGFPKLTILYNTDQVHQAIAELARKQWQRELGITVTLRNEEWASTMDAQSRMDFMLSRRSWVGDYVDPNTFLDMYVTGGTNNNTGFGDPKYDQLIADAAKETDKGKRMQLFQQAERILMDAVPIIPIYVYVSRNLVKPKVRNFYNNPRDDHPIRAMWIDDKIKDDDPHPKNEYMSPPVKEPRTDRENTGTHA